VSRTGRKLVDAQPNELVIGNIVRRVLGLIRDEASEDRGDAGDESASDAPTPTDIVPPAATSQQWATRRLDSANSAAPAARPPIVSSYSSINPPKSLFHLLSTSPPADGDVSPFRNSGASTPTWRGNSSQIHALRSEVIDGIEEIKDEISQVDDQIAASAEVQIHPGDLVLVHQPSTTVERFILRAAQKRKFTVLIAVAPPRRHSAEGQHATFRKKLSAAGITVVNVMNGGLMAYMSRVNKVIIGARAIVATGGVVADAGAAAIARAAKEQGTAVVVLSGVYKLSPESPFDESSLIEWGDSSTFVSFADGPLVSGAEIRTALTELIQPELVDTYITNLYVLSYPILCPKSEGDERVTDCRRGTHSRDHLSSLISDHYKREDADFHIWEEAEP
jgi:translation initiation factor eIF-2B subunit beta